MTNHLIDIKGAGVSYPMDDGSRKIVLKDIDLQVAPGEFCTVVGPSGCGKSTLLQLIWGKNFPNEGTVLVDGQKVWRVSRDCGIVFQNYLLAPFLTVLDNIAFGDVLSRTTLFDRLIAKPFQIIGWVFDFLLNLLVGFGNLMVGGLFARKGMKPPAERAFKRSGKKSLWLRGCERVLKFYRVREEARTKARELMVNVSLDPRDAEKYPFELSGGMKQRVAIAQALLIEPKILLMDEPFGALDAKTRSSMQDFIHDCWAKFGLTVFFVTHDLDEAVRLGTRLICLSQYWTDADGKQGVGARVVRDRHIEGGATRPSEFKGTDEYKELITSINNAGLDAKKLIPLTAFDLTHPDAIINPTGARA
jgi:ABC-type nitrate/sulfonate/bicarbonate transport system ATPase subunit